MQPVPGSAELTELADRVRPVALAGEQVLPVPPSLAGVLPWPGLRRGATVSVAGIGGTSLALALVSGASRTGSWVAAVGVGDLGLAAAAELGICLDRLAVIAEPPSEVWATVVASLVGAFDVVLVAPPARVGATATRRLAARQRERGTVLVVLDGHRATAGSRLDGRGSTAAHSALEVDLCLELADPDWEGLGQGHGRLEARRVVVQATGRRRAARPRRAELWLVDAGRRVAVVPGTEHDVPAAARTGGGVRPWGVPAGGGA
ncbi:MAG: hypothetical protein MUF83_21625 [Acidimicrobiales bacterium]|nr:hypothetical protein [Acidimicrobiales bacterium]